MANVSRNGTLLLNLTQHGNGGLDAEAIQTAKEIGVWLKVNGEAVYGSRPFEVYGDTSVYYTRNKNKLYATVIEWKDSPIYLKALAANGATLGKVTKVELLGSDNSALSLPFLQNAQGLTVTPQAETQPLGELGNTPLAHYRVLRITHDKNWLNDDDPGVQMAQGWFRKANLNEGDFNNDLTISETRGAKWQFSFIGKGIPVIAPKQPGGGKIEILIDGKTKKIVDLSSDEGRQSQQDVYDVAKLAPGNHTVTLINRNGRPVAIDALVIINK